MVVLTEVGNLVGSKQPELQRSQGVTSHVQAGNRRGMAGREDSVGIPLQLAENDQHKSLACGAMAGTMSDCLRHTRSQRLRVGGVDELLWPVAHLRDTQSNPPMTLPRKNSQGENLELVDSDAECYASRPLEPLTCVQNVQVSFDWDKQSPNTCRAAAVRAVRLGSRFGSSTSEPVSLTLAIEQPSS